MAYELRQQAQTVPQESHAPRFAGMRISLRSRGVSAQERMLFTERLALLLDTGVSLVEALNAMRAQTEDPRIARILGSLAATLEGGKSFCVALSHHPEMFSQTYVSLVAAAEEGGFLPEVLQQLHAMDEKRAQLQSSIVSALSYPAFLIVFSILVVIFMLTVIFPKFDDLFQTIRGDLPTQTLVLMFVSEFLRKYWLLVSIAAGAGLWGAVAWCRSPAGVLALDRLKMSVPLVKDVFVQIYLTETLSSLGMSLANGVPITVALKASQDIVRNAVFGALLGNINKQVNEGKGVAAGFRECALFPPMVGQMIATAEQTGNLAKVMTRIADFYARELQKRITLFAKAIEPVMLVVMGIVVGLIVSALILPIFKLSRAVH